MLVFVSWLDFSFWLGLGIAIVFRLVLGLEFGLGLVLG